MEEHVFKPQNEAVQSEEIAEIEEDDNSALIQTIIRLIIGLIIVIAIGALAVFAFVNFRGTKIFSTRTNTSPTPTKAVSQKQPKTPSPTQTPLTQLNPIPSDWKSFNDSNYDFSIKIPSTWEAYKRAGTNGSYQLGIRPSGSLDVPITINLYENPTKLSLSEWVAQSTGPNTSSEKGKIGGKDAIFVRNDSGNYVTYYMTNGGKVYELSASIVNKDYYSIFEKIIASFKFQ